MIIGYQDKKSFQNNLKFLYNLVVDKFALLNKKPFFLSEVKKFNLETPLIIKKEIPIEIYWMGFYIETLTYQKVIKSIKKDSPYIIINPSNFLNAHLLDGITQTNLEKTVCFDSTTPLCHTPINFFDDLLSIGSIKDILNILKPNSEEYKKYFYEKEEVSKMIKTIKILMSYLCLLLKKEKEKKNSISLNLIKKTLENFELYKKNKFYLKLLDEMNYLNKHISLNHQVRHFQLSQVVWQIYFAHFTILEKNNLISSNTSLTIRQLIKNQKNYIFNKMNENSTYLLNDIFTHYINALLKEEKVAYQVVCSIKDSIHNFYFCENCTYKIIYLNEDIDDKNLIQLKEKMQKEELLMVLKQTRFDKVSPSSLNSFLGSISYMDILEKNTYFIFLDNKWQECMRLNEFSQTSLTHEHFKILQSTQCKITDEIQALNEKQMFEKVIKEKEVEKKPKRVKI